MALFHASIIKKTLSLSQSEVPSLQIWENCKVTEEIEGFFYINKTSLKHSQSKPAILMLLDKLFALNTVKLPPMVS